ncbi:MAG: heme exporter protein CcmB [Coriobacteriales bacterium]|jgi:heme exporter protein B|nr:heme exporter protein CcmB [Coriobacteriales bacterium]
MAELTIVRPSAFKQFRVLLGKELRQEFRTREMLTSMGIYALLVLVIFGAALSQAAQGFDILQVSGGLIWALIVFTSLLGLNRSFSSEKEEAALEGILLMPMDRSLIFLSKATSNLIFLLLVELISLPLFYFFFLTISSPAPSFWMASLPLLVGSIGIAGVGTLLATITSNARGKDVLLALLFIPIIYPLLHAVVAATTVVVVGGDNLVGTFATSLALAGGYDVVMLALSWFLYEFVISN